MPSSDDLAFWANIAAIAGFFVTSGGVAVGIIGYFRYRNVWRRKTDALVSYLKKEKDEAEKTGRKGQHTATHLIRHVGLTEDEILKISFESPHIDRRVGVDEAGKAERLYFAYNG